MLGYGKSGALNQSKLGWICPVCPRFVLHPSPFCSLLYRLTFMDSIKGHPWGSKSHFIRFRAKSNINTYKTIIITRGITVQVHVLKLKRAWESPGGHVKYKWLIYPAPLPQLLIYWVSRLKDFTSNMSQMMLILLVQGPQLENGSVKIHPTRLCTKCLHHF